MKSTETFQNILGSQKGMHDKTGLGFNTSKIRQSYENTFISEKEKIKCLFCHKEGHLESYCFHKKRVLNTKPEHSHFRRPEGYNKPEHSRLRRHQGSFR